VEREPAEVESLAPIELVDVLRGDAEGFEVGADPQRGHDRDPERCDLDHRPTAEVVVVIVREQHGVERQELGERRGRCVEALGAREGDGGGAESEDGIGEHAVSVDLQQYGAVTQPRDPQAGVDSCREAFVRPSHRERSSRRALGSPEEELAQERERLALKPRRDTRRVREDAVLELRRAHHALSSYALIPLASTHVASVARRRRASTTRAGRRALGSTQRHGW
jgi:hypothetical protein